jgi:hypothetical protein
MSSDTNGPLNIKPLQDLLSKDMDRKEFLIHVGGVMLAVVGITGLIKKLSDPFGKTRPSTANTSSGVGYGASTYGGSVDKGMAPQQKGQLSS